MDISASLSRLRSFNHVIGQAIVDHDGKVLVPVDAVLRTYEEIVLLARGGAAACPQCNRIVSVERLGRDRFEFDCNACGQQTYDSAEIHDNALLMRERGTVPGPRRAPKFVTGDRVVGRDEGRASFRGRVGTVEVRGPSRGEYGVRFDDEPTRVEYVMSNWIAKTEP